MRYGRRKDTSERSKQGYDRRKGGREEGLRYVQVEVGRGVAQAAKPYISGLYIISTLLPSGATITPLDATLNMTPSSLPSSSSSSSSLLWRRRSVSPAWERKAGQAVAWIAAGTKIRRG